MWTVIGTVLATLFVVMLVTNLRGPEKQPKQRMKHLFPIADPQLKLEMGTLLGPGILPGNRITALQNGDEIFPAMLEAIRGAQRTITFETYI
jgi:cardiolipin synthase